MDEGRGRVVLDPLDELARRHAKGARRIGLAEGVLHGVRRGVVAAHLQDDLAVAPDHRHRHGVALALAEIGSGRGDGERRRERQILARQQLRVGRCCEGKTQPSDAEAGKEPIVGHSRFSPCLTNPINRREVIESNNRESFLASRRVSRQGDAV